MILSVILRIEIIHVNLIMIVRNHRLLPTHIIIIKQLGIKQETYPAGRTLARASAILGSRLGGKTTLNCRIILPFSNGFLYCGIPSPWICFRSPVLMTSPTIISNQC